MWASDSLLNLLKQDYFPAQWTYHQSFSHSETVGEKEYAYDMTKKSINSSSFEPKKGTRSRVTSPSLRMPLLVENVLLNINIKLQIIATLYDPTDRQL